MATEATKVGSVARSAAVVKARAVVVARVTLPPEGNGISWPSRRVHRRTRRAGGDGTVVCEADAGAPATRSAYTSPDAR